MVNQQLHLYAADGSERYEKHVLISYRAQVCDTGQCFDAVREPQRRMDDGNNVKIVISSDLVGWTHSPSLRIELSTK